MNEVLQTGIPVLAVALAALWNNNRIGTLETRMNARFDTVDAELRYFHDKTGNLDGRVEELSKRVP